jgi:hypothetical protein
MAKGVQRREINLFTTILETFDGLYVSAPNGGIWANSHRLVPGRVLEKPDKKDYGADGKTKKPADEYGGSFVLQGSYLGSGLTY